MNVEVELSRILISELGSEQVILLKEKGGARTFPIVIGLSEALAIDRRLKGERVPRPMTHDLLAGVIGAMGGQLERVVIDDLRALSDDDDHQTFIATLHIRRNHEIITVDSRPSDAIALSAGCGARVFVSDKVFNDVLSKPQSAADRIELLRKRLEFLAQRIADLTAMLDGESQADAKDHQLQISDMQREYDAIDRVLKKLG